MTELLKRWASLEPTWCRVDDERAGVMTDVSTPLARLRFEAQFHRLGQYEPHILAAVIEALAARGWWWRLDGDAQNGYLGYVERQPGSDTPHVASEDTPAAALLGAYLAALEAQEGTNP